MTTKKTVNNAQIIFNLPWLKKIIFKNLNVSVKSRIKYIQNDKCQKQVSLKKKLCNQFNEMSEKWGTDYPYEKDNYNIDDYFREGIIYSVDYADYFASKKCYFGHIDIKYLQPTKKK